MDGPEDARRDALIENLARRLERAGLVTPAVALLEAHEPLSFLGSQALLFMQPMLAPFVGGTGDLVSVLEDRRSVELLVRRLEAGPRKEADTPESGDPPGSEGG